MRNLCFVFIFPAIRCPLANMPAVGSRPLLWLTDPPNKPSKSWPERRKGQLRKWAMKAGRTKRHCEWIPPDNCRWVVHPVILPHPYGWWQRRTRRLHLPYLWHLPSTSGLQTLKCRKKSPDINSTCTRIGVFDSTLEKLHPSLSLKWSQLPQPLCPAAALLWDSAQQNTGKSSSSFFFPVFKLR